MCRTEINQRYNLDDKQYDEVLSRNIIILAIVVLIAKRTVTLGASVLFVANEGTS